MSVGVLGHADVCYLQTLEPGRFIIKVPPQR